MTSERVLAPCPNPECGSPCQVDSYAGSPDAYEVTCYGSPQKWKCWYRGPRTTTESEAIRLHNLIASAVPLKRLEELAARFDELDEGYEHGGYRVCANQVRALINEYRKPSIGGR